MWTTCQKHCEHDSKFDSGKKMQQSQASLWWPSYKGWFCWPDARKSSLIMLALIHQLWKEQKNPPQPRCWRSWFRWNIDNGVIDIRNYVVD